MPLAVLELSSPLASAELPKALLSAPAVAFCPTAVELIPLAVAPVPHWNEPATGSEQKVTSVGTTRLAAR